ncbi:MAG: hypothetical protein ACK493_05505 [Planctomycetota bacterium]|jgi:hypothetical protein
MQISGFIVLLTGIILSRIINERGYRKLNAEQKIRLMDGFSTTRAYSMIPLLLLIAAFWFLNSETNIDKQILTAGYFGLLLVYIIARVVLNQRKIAQLELPGEYTRMFTLAQVVSFIGVAWFFFAMFYR